MRREQISSPSWKQIRVRSSSLPRIKIEQNQAAHQSSWANSWLPQNDRTTSQAQAQAMTTNRRTIHRHGSMLRSNTTSSNTSTLVSPTITEHALSPQRPRLSLLRTPVLTLALLKLDEQLLPYCQYLKDPSYENVAAACALLDSAVSTASPHASERLGSPSSGYHVGSPLASSTGSRSPRSPIAWLTGSTDSFSPNNNGVSASALALEGEWEKVVVPFFLLAGAEAVYADLGHSVDDRRIARNLIGLYTRIHKDMRLVRQILCDPFVLPSEDAQHRQGQQQPQQLQPPVTPPTTTPTLSMYLERASKVAMSLDALANMAEMRCQLIRLHCSMWSSSSSSSKKQGSVAVSAGPDFSELGGSFHDMLPNVPQEGAHAQPMCDALDRELKTWVFLMETAFGLERCRFAETILSAQKSKSFLELNSKSCIQIWVKRSLQRMIATMPILFDRIQTFAKPLYGFNRNLIRDTSSEQDASRLGADRDFESDVLEFLQRQEKAGSPAIAVSVVLDAVVTANRRVERGFALAEANLTSTPSSPTVGEGINPSESIMDHWPSVYMRTTMHHGVSAATSGGGILGGMRRTANRSNDHKLGLAGSKSHEEAPSLKTRTASSIILRSWSNEASPNAAQDSAKKSHQSKQMNVLEYGPESGSATSSWPHSTWKSLVALLTGAGNPMASPASTNDAAAPVNTSPFASFGPIEVDLKTLSLQNWSGLNSPTVSTNNLPQASLAPISKLAKSDSQTSIHVSAISDYLWLVVMIKGEEESRWHRRRSRADIEDEARQFLKDMAPLLRMSDWFSSTVEISQLRQGTLKASATRSTSSTSKFNHGEHVLINALKADRNWDEDDLQEHLVILKELFGLRPPLRPTVGPLRQMSSYGLSLGSAIAGFKRSPRFNSRRPTRAAGGKSASYRTSAAALFLGVDLMHAVGE